MSERPTGAFAPVPTPVTADGRFDAPTLERHLSWLAERGLDGALILGTNGEFPSFSVSERLEIAAAAAASGSELGLQLMLGVGSCALPDVCELLRAAAQHGFVAALCPPPFYFRAAPVAGVCAFFDAVLEAAELPVLLYHIPQVTGVPIDDSLLDLLKPSPRLEGVKDSSGASTELTRLSKRFRSGSYMVGNDAMVSACRQAGGVGSITAVASIAPEIVAAAASDESAQEHLVQVRKILERYGLGPSVKAVLRHRGIGEYASRPPLRDLDPEALPRLLAELRNVGVE